MSTASPVTTSALDVGPFLLSKGFNLASPNGFAIHAIYPECTGIGILQRNSTNEARTYFEIIARKPPRREFLGVIWLNSRIFGVEQGHVVIEAFGSDHIALLNDLAKEMATQLGLIVSVSVTGEGHRSEVFSSDLDG